MRKLAFLLCAILAVAGCDRRRTEASIPTGLSSAPSARTAPSPTLGSSQTSTTTEASAAPDPAGALKFPKAGTPYDKAREQLISEGATIAPDKASSPHPLYKELDCWGRGEVVCTARFLLRDARGWCQYIVVETSGGKAPNVVEARWANTVDGLPDIPPPPAADIPKLPARYPATRRKLLALGFKPTHAAPDCTKRSDDGEQDPDCLADPGLPEVAHCFPTGAGECTAFWLSPDGKKVLMVSTIGEPQPGRIYYAAWATAQDTAELRAGWRR